MSGRIYISGCGGMLGEAFYAHFHSEYELRCTDIDVNDSWLSYCDVRDWDSYRQDVIDFGADYLFHLAALTDLEYCEIHPDEAYLTNTLGVENAVWIANQMRIPLLYISTAGIFDGQKDTYDDWDTPNPMGHYARSKYAGEVFVRENARSFLICRAGWMMGGGPQKDKKFVGKIIRQITAGQTEIFVVNDKLGTPTYTHDFARNVNLLLRNNFTGVFNLVCQGKTSRLEVAKEIIRILNLQDCIRITEVSSDYFSEQYFAPRPPSERLVNTRLRLRGMDIMRDWRVALREYLETYYKELFR